MPIEFTSLRKVIWSTDEQFEHKMPFGVDPVLSNVEVIGSGDDAYLALAEKDDNSDNVPFTTPANYDYDDTKIEVDSGKAKLKASIQSDSNFPYTTPANYNYNSNLVTVTGGVAKLVGNPVPTYAWYHMNASSGTNVADSSGNGRNGTTQNMEDGDWVSGKLNNALLFDGTDEYVDTNFSVSWERTQPVSFEFWIKTSTTGVTRAIISNFASPGGQLRGHEILVGSNNKIVFYIFGNNTNRLGVESTNTVTDGSWHHVVCTYDGTSSPTGMHIYIDNNDETLNTLYNTLASTTILASNFHIARRQSGGIYFDGTLDEIVFYDQEIDSAEVNQRWNSGAGTENPIDAYNRSKPGIETLNGFVFTFLLGTFTETATKPAGTEIKYQLSIDDGITYKWWNGSAWVNRTLTHLDVPSSINTTTGTPSGTVTDIQTLDANVYTITEVTGTPGFETEIVFDPSCVFPDTVKIYGYYNGNPAHVVNVDIWNYTTSAWDTLGQIPNSGATVVTLYTFTVTGNPQDYQSCDNGGDSKIRIIHTSPGNTGHVLGLDYVEISGIPTCNWFYDNESNDDATINTNISALGSSGTLRVLSFLYSELGSATPELDNIKIEEGISYPTAPQVIEMLFDIDPTDNIGWLNVIETSTKPATTSINFQYSTDSGSSYNGSWLTLAQLITAIQNISSPDKLRLKFQLDTNDGDVTPELDNLEITSDAGFETSGYYISTGYYPEYTNAMGIFILQGMIQRVADLTNTVVVKLREATSILDENSVFVDYDFSDNEIVPLELSGELIQWRVDFAGDGTTTGRLNKVEFDFYIVNGLLEPLRFLKYR